MDIKDRLDNWHNIKKTLEINDNIPLFRQNEIWWCHVGQNLGSEIYGKGEDYSRPVYILKKINKTKFIGIPMSTKLSDDNRFYPLKINKRDGGLCFNEIRSFSAKRLRQKIYKLSDNEHQKIINAFKNYLAM